MFKVISSTILGFILSSTAFANENAYYEIKSVEVKNVTKHYAPYMDLYAQPGLNENCNSASLAPAHRHVFGTNANSDAGFGPLDTGFGPLDTVSVVVDQIINIGKKIWTIVEAGKPVVNVKFDTANALPKGVSCWTDLAGWSLPQTQVYNVSYTNGLGMKVVDFSYRVLFTANGNIDGVGQYITNATFLPADINVKWGFKFDAEASVPSVLNQGTKTAPLAGMQMDMKWTVSSPLSENIHSESYFVSGDNRIVNLP